MTSRPPNHRVGGPAATAHLVQGVHGDLAGADVAQVAIGVVLEVVGHGHPDGLLAAVQVVLVDETGDRAALADTGTVTWRSITGQIRQCQVRLGQKSGRCKQHPTPNDFLASQTKTSV